MNKQNQGNIGFTLVELIVVITILAILGTIAIMAFSGYSKNARDSARISDIGSIKKTLELWVMQSGSYPEPNDGIDVTFSGSMVLWKQGVFGDIAFNTVGKIDKKPVDPLYNNEYTYSLTNSKKEYQIGAVLEKNTTYTPIINQTYAATEGLAYVSGTYNGILTTINLNPSYVIALPSIILSDLTNPNIDGISEYSLVYEGKSNLPSSYKTIGFSMTGGGLGFVPQIVWTGTGISNLNNQNEFQELVENLQTVYNSGSLFSALPEYSSIVGEGGLTTVALSSVKSLIETSTKTELTNVSTIPANSCSPNPGYTHTNYIQGYPTVFNQLWQNTNSNNPCFYECESALYTGDDCHLATFFTGTGTFSDPWKKLDGTSLVSCQDYNNQATSSNEGFIRGSGLCGDGTKQCLSDGVYFVAPDGNEANKYPIYCDMNSNGGGWTLAMKIKSSTSVLGYDSTYWTSTGLLNTTDTSIITDSDAKYKAFHNVSGNTLKFCMNNSGIKCINKSYTGTLASFTALPISTQIGYTVGSTILTGNPTDWVTSLGFTIQGQALCNGTDYYTYLKIGVLLNDSAGQGCMSTDYGWGFGGKNTYSGVSVGAGYVSSWGGTPKSGYIYVR